MPRFLRILSVSNSSTVTSAVADPPASAKVESEFVVMLAGLLGVIMCVVGLVAVAHCRSIRRSINRDSARSPSQPNKGIKKKSLDLLPKFAYSTTEESSKGFASTECAICLAEFVEGDVVRVLPHCGHGFHVGCIDTWLGSHSSCPSCRHILVVATCRRCGQSPAALSSSPNSCGEAAASPRVELKSSGDAASVTADTNHSQNASFLP